MYLNANIPIIECYVRGNYLRDQKDSHDKYFEVGVFGFSSIPNRVPLFHFLMEDGGLWWRAPITALSTKPGVKECQMKLIQGEDYHEHQHIKSHHFIGPSSYYSQSSCGIYRKNCNQLL